MPQQVRDALQALKLKSEEVKSRTMAANGGMYKSGAERVARGSMFK